MCGSVMVKLCGPIVVKMCGSLVVQFSVWPSCGGKDVWLSAGTDQCVAQL